MYTINFYARLVETAFWNKMTDVPCFENPGFLKTMVTTNQSIDYKFVEITENNITYGDWYLPSKFELGLIQQNASIINTTASANGGDNLINDVYWSSTENTMNNAWVVNLSDGQESSVFKSIPNPVRAIRSF